MLSPRLMCSNSALFTFTANSYSKIKYQNKIRDIIHVKLTSNAERHKLTLNKEVILVIDLSQSMYSSLNNLKSALLTFRDLIIGHCSNYDDNDYINILNLSPESKDDIFRNTIYVTLITFNESAKEIWSSRSSNITFEEAVLKMNTNPLTNMGSGIELAFNITNPDLFTWIVVMTDGESNKGKYRHINSFQSLATKKPLNSKIITLGYGKDCNLNILNNIGYFTHIKNKEDISIVFCSISIEIIYSWGFNCIIDAPNYKSIIDDSSIDVNSSTIIVADGMENNIVKTLMGNRIVGPILLENVYDYIYLPHGTIKDYTMLKKYKKVVVSYSDISTGRRYTHKIKIRNSSNISNIENIQKKLKIEN